MILAACSRLTAASGGLCLPTPWAAPRQEHLKPPPMCELGLGFPWGPAAPELSDTHRSHPAPRCLLGVHSHPVLWPGVFREGNEADGHLPSIPVHGEAKAPRYQQGLRPH